MAASNKHVSSWIFDGPPMQQCRGGCGGQFQVQFVVVYHGLGRAPTIPHTTTPTKGTESGDGYRRP